MKRFLRNFNPLRPSGLLALGLILSTSTAWACPFCSATSQTLSEEMIAADAAVLAKLIASPPPANDANGPGDASTGESTFQVVRVLKGEEHMGGAKELKALHFGEVTPETTFLITGQLLPDLKWATPIPLSPRAEKYVGQLLALPEKGAPRLEFFQAYLEDEDSVLAQDAYDEFARAPYDDVKALKPQMNHDQLVAWIKDTEVSPSHRRLYLTMLSVCGGQNDLPMLEEMMRSDDRRTKAGLDAMVACYLTIRGADGMPLVEELFLKNDKAEYADTYAAIMAIRFHGQESDVIPRARLLEGLHHMLNRPELADLVISDLARWEDWAVMDQLIDLFKNAEDASSWVRVPVINYLQAAARQPDDLGQRAQAAIEELAEIDPGAVKQAQTYAAFGGLTASPAPAGEAPPVTDDASATDKEATPDEKTAEMKTAPADEDPAPSLAEPAKTPAPTSVASEPVTTERTAPSVLTPAASDAVVGAESAASRAEVEQESVSAKRIGMLILIGLVVVVAFRIASRSGGRQGS